MGKHAPTQCFGLLLALLCVLAWNGLCHAATYALVVGVGGYDDATIGKATAAVQDAKAVAEALDDAGEIILLVDSLLPNERPSRVNVLANLRELSNRAEAGDLLVFFFAGHGTCAVDARTGAEDLFLLPFDVSSMVLPETGIAFATVLDLIDDSPARKLLFLDAGRTGGGALLKSLTAALEQRLRERVEGMTVILSCGVGQQSLLTAGEDHSLFAKSLVEGMKGAADADRDGFIGVNEIVSFAAEATTRCARERGFEQSPALLSTLTEDAPLLTIAKAHRSEHRAPSHPAADGVLSVPDEYSSIQAAVDEARAGETVRVRKGLYNESVVFKEGIRLVGEGRDKVTIHYDGAQGNTILVKDCASGLIADLTINHMGVSTGEWRYSVLDIVHSSVTVRQCAVQRGVGHGIRIRGGGDPVVEDCVARNNWWNAIHVIEEGTAPVIRNTECIENGMRGVSFEEGAAGLAEHVICMADAQGGISVLGQGTAPTLKNNACDHNRNDGICFGEGAGGVAEDNSCAGNERNGIRVFGEGTCVSLIRNDCSNNNQHGIRIEAGVGDVTLSENRGGANGLEFLRDARGEQQ